MNDKQMDALMQLVPEKYLEETMQYCMEHARDTVPGITKKSVPRRCTVISSLPTGDAYSMKSSVSIST